jgi:hypothetical protein
LVEIHKRIGREVCYRGGEKEKSERERERERERESGRK